MKLFRWTNFRNNFTEIKATIKAPINPVAIINHSEDVYEKLVFTKSNPVAASMVGTARIKENSAAAFLFVPKIRRRQLSPPTWKPPGL